MKTKIVTFIILSMLQNVAISSEYFYFERGETAFDVNDVEFVAIYLVKPNGRYITRDVNDNAMNQNETERDLAKLNGCGKKGRFCVHDQAFDINDVEYVEVIGIKYNGDYVTRDLNDSAYNVSESNYDLARLHGCGDYGVCVGAKAYDLNDDEEVKIIAIQENGKFVTEDLNDGAINVNEKYERDFLLL